MRRSRSPERRTPGQERGQATVELALVLPLLLLLALVALQVGLVARDQVLLVQATREAARAAAVGEGAVPPPTPGGLDPARLHLAVTEGTGLVRAVGTYRTPIVVPLLTWVRREVVLGASLAMRAERA
jgi:hypothetical protein